MRIRIYILIAALALAGCNLGAGGGTPAAQTLPAAEVATATVPAIAVTVNGESITLESYNANLALYQAAQAQTGTLLASQDAKQAVIDQLVDRMLLAQGARETGLATDDAKVDERLTNLTTQAGGAAAMDTWLSTHGFSAEAFHAELRLEIEAAAMRDQIAAGVPTTAEQVEARQILLTDEFQAERLLGQLESGTPFETVVQNNDPQRLGTLGWFPRGYLLQPEVEEAAFALQPGEHSQVVQSALGYHLIEVIARDASRPLSPQALLALQVKAVEDWLAARRAQSVIEILLP
jgi:parvulin-like peptidyl-prolyl isomerase